MLLRVFLILAILAGIGAIALTQFKVRPHIQGIIDKRNEETARADKAESDLRSTRKDLKDTQAELGSTKKQLTDTQNQLTAARAEAASERDRANQTKKELTQTQAELRSTQQDLSAWKSLGIGVDQVKALIAAEKQLRVDIEALREEKKIITDNLNRALAKIKIYEGGLGEDLEVPLPPGTKGRVLIVDPKWRFVVLDLGRKQHVEENGVLMVQREGRLIAKVKIKRVEDDKCIANVMPGWNFDEIREGDIVFN